MKKVLSLLLAFMFLQVQTWALSGGPDYNRNNRSVNALIGTYGGVLISTGTTSTATDTSSSTGSMGVFSLSVPQSGFASGQAVIFVRGTPFIGQVAAVADANKKRITGIFSATSSFTVVIGPDFIGLDGNGDPIFTEEEEFPVFATGSFKVKVIEGNRNAFNVAPVTGTGSPTSLETGSTNAARLQGTANVDTFFRIRGADGTPIVNETTTFEVDGVKQSNLVSTVAAPTFTF